MINSLELELQEIFIFENKRNGFLKTISAWLKLKLQNQYNQVIRKFLLKSKIHFNVYTYNSICQLLLYINLGDWHMSFYIVFLAVL